MNTVNPLSVLLIVLLAAALVLSIAARRLARERSRARRLVERPNSHYTSPIARNSETRDRWHNIALDRLHELNSGEVVRLLAKVDASGVESLRPNERMFLDRMAELSGARPPGREPGPPSTPDLRHSPA